MTELRTWRKQKGLTQRKLGEALGLTDSAITKYENGSQRPRPELAKRIEAYTKGEVSAASLMGLEKASAPARRGRALREDATSYDRHVELAVAVPLNPEILADLRAMGVDVEAIARNAAGKGLKEAYSAAFRETNKEIIEENRRYVEKNGTFGEQLGLI